MIANARYGRQTILPEIGFSGQDKLGKASALVVGAGGLGCPALLSLVLSGVGHITIVDGDRVEISNLHRQMLFTEKQIGQSKAQAAAEQLRERNSEVRIDAIDGFVTPGNARNIFNGHDLVLDGSDNFPTRYLLSDVASALGIPLVSGALQGFQAQITVLNYPTPAGKPGPAYRCLFPEPSKRVPDCKNRGMLGSVSGWAGMVMANEALKIIVGHGTTLSGKIMLIDALHNDCIFLEAERNPRAFEIGRQNGKDPLRVDYGQACNQDDDELEVNAEELEKILREGSAILLDIREGTQDAELPVRQIPFSKIVAPGADWPFKEDVILICDFGAVSARLVKKLKQKHPSAEIRSLRGGGLAWSLYKEGAAHVV